MTQRPTLVLVVVMVVILLSVGSDGAQLWTNVMTAAIFAIGINILTGLAGQVSFGHALFYGTGAYGVALATGAGMSWVVGMAAAVVLCIIGGLILGRAALRVTGHYLAMLTFAAGMAWYLGARNLGFTGGIVGKQVDLGHLGLFGLDLSQQMPLAIVTLVILAIATASFSALRHAPFGQLLVGVRENETLLMTAGVDVARYKVAALVLSAVFAAVAGSLFAVNTAYVDPSSFQFSLSIEVVVIVALGGIGTPLGPWLGAVLYVGADDLLSSWGDLRAVVFGCLLLLVFITFPQGLNEILTRILRFVGRLGSERTDRLPDDKDAVAAPPRAVHSPAPRSVPGTAGAGSGSGAQAPGLLELRSVTKDYSGVHVLKGVDLVAGAGELIAVVGPNGAGKSTLFNCMTGWTKATGGEVLVDGLAVTEMPPIKVARSGVSRSFQTPRIIDSLTVRDNARLSELQRRRAPDDGGGETATLETVLASLGLGHVLHARAQALTYGQRKRLELARVLLEDPRILLLDEPFAGLSEAEIAESATHMDAYARNGGLVLFVEHHLRTVMTLASRVVVLDFGQVIADGPPDEVRDHPSVSRAYQITSGVANPQPEAHQ